MKTRLLALLPAALMLACLPGCGAFRLNAFTPGTQSLSFRPRAMTPEAAFARYDKNFDGQLAAAETDASCLTEAGIAFDQYDDDANGQISFKELLAHPESPCGSAPD